MIMALNKLDGPCFTSEDEDVSAGASLPCAGACAAVDVRPSVRTLTQAGTCVPPTAARAETHRPMAARTPGNQAFRPVFVTPIPGFLEVPELCHTEPEDLPPELPAQLRDTPRPGACTATQGPASQPSGGGSRPRCPCDGRGCAHLGEGHRGWREWGQPCAVGKGMELTGVQGSVPSCPAASMCQPAGALSKQ